MQAKRNDLSKQVGQLKSKGGDAVAVMAEVASLKDRMAAAEIEEQKAAAELERFAGAAAEPAGRRTCRTAPTKRQPR